MVKKTMYQKIQQKKRQGYNKSEIGRVLNIDRKTVRKYHNMTEEQYQQYIVDAMYRDKVFDKYKAAILELYSANDNKKLNMAAVYDYLEEKFGKLSGAETTLRYFINYLIKKGDLVYSENTRLYQKVDELPYGKQMQLDFGEFRVNKDLKLYIFATVLSSSRFKYVAFQDKPFTTKDVISHLLDTFDYYQGRPEELVIDQDSVMVVSENHGDIIYTKCFKDFIREMDLKMFVCRKADPETKGKIENLVKYVKYNFLSVRSFETLEKAQESLEKWLTRRANGKISHATKRIPLEVIAEERKKLRPVKNSIHRKDSMIYHETRLVSKECFISYHASYYSVPVKYRNGQVSIYATAKKIYIFDEITGIQVAEHSLSLLPGKKVSKKDHSRDKEKKASELKKETLKLSELPKWEVFANHNFKRFPRYSRDQCQLAKKFFEDKNMDENILQQALNFCLENNTYSLSELTSTYRSFIENQKLEQQKKPMISIFTNNKQHKSIQVNNRPVSDYESMKRQKEVV